MGNLLTSNKLLALLVVAAVVGAAIYLFRSHKEATFRKAQVKAVEQNVQAVVSEDGVIDDVIHFGRGHVTPDGTYIPTERGTYGHIAALTFSSTK
jgi:hypothetical protein